MVWGEAAAADGGISISFIWTWLDLGGHSSWGIHPAAAQHLSRGLLTPSLLTQQTGTYGCLITLLLFL